MEQVNLPLEWTFLEVNPIITRFNYGQFCNFSIRFNTKLYWKVSYFAEMGWGANPISYLFLHSFVQKNRTFFAFICKQFLVLHLGTFFTRNFARFMISLRFLGKTQLRKETHSYIHSWNLLKHLFCEIGQYSGYELK